MKQTLALTYLALLLFALPARAQLELNEGDSVIVVGNTFAERMALSGYFDAVVHITHPDAQITIRHVPNSADEVDNMPRERSVPDAEFYLNRHGADVIVMCFGMSESFDGVAGLDAFRAALSSRIDGYLGQQYNGESAPRLVLVSPIAHEYVENVRLSELQVQSRNNDVLYAYKEAMREVAEAKGVAFVDLFTPTMQKYPQSDEPMTNNGIAPNELGCHYAAAQIAYQLGWADNLSFVGEGQEQVDSLQRACYDKHYHFRLRYRATNTEYVWGRRHQPFGDDNFPPELDQLDRMTVAREAAIWAMDKPTFAQFYGNPPSGAAVWETIPDSQAYAEDVWQLPEIAFEDRGGSIGTIPPETPAQLSETFTMADGYEINLFASEEQFPELANPLGMQFDDRGRLWVLCSPTYPHLLPGEQPACKILIFTDTDNDGVADDMTVFIDDMNIPTGFVIDTDCAYVGQAPDLWRLSDTDGDDVADRREIVYSGFGMPDSHHTISAFEWDPNGGILMLEGVFTRSNVETPYGTYRTRDAAVWRYDPRTQTVIPVAHTGHPNPWGQTYDNYGQSIMMDTSGPGQYNFTQLIQPWVFPNKPNKGRPVVSDGRPTAGCEIIYSRHFPEDVQGTYLYNQCIGFYGTRWKNLITDGATQSGYTSSNREQNLVSNTQANFRPVSIEIGPDGAMYIADWCNPLIGHMQFNVRDPRRDHTRGRVWRVTYPENPLVELPNVADASVEELFELLKVPERNTRQLARRRLQRMDPEAISAMAKAWLLDLNPREEEYDRYALEALWVMQGVGVYDPEVIDEVVTRAREPRARAGGVRVLRYGLQFGDLDSETAKPYIAQAVNDRDMRVRIEAVMACAFLDDPTAADIANQVTNQPMDDALRNAHQSTIRYLEDRGIRSVAGLPRLYDMDLAELQEQAEENLDGVIALAVLARPDVRDDSSDDPHALRRRALHAAAQTDNERAALLVDTVNNFLFDPDRAVQAVTPLLLELPTDALRSVEADINAMLVNDEPARRGLAMAAKIMLGTPIPDLASRDPVALVAGLNALPDGQAPPGAAVQLMELVESGQMQPALAIGQAVRLSSDINALFQRLAGFIDAAQAIGYEQWGSEHILAMAALQAMHDLPDEQWPQGFDRYRVTRGTDIPYGPYTDDEEHTDNYNLFTLGQKVYNHEERGCVRCHGAEGQGGGGYPPLANSAWVTGDPLRAAAIVRYGLKGPLHMDGYTDLAGSGMESMSHLNNDEIAATLTYVRQSWGNYTTAVTPDQIVSARRPGDGGVWQTADLLERHPFERDRIMGPLPPPQISALAWAPPKAGMVLMLATVAVGMGLILFPTWAIARASSDDTHAMPSAA